MKLRLFFVLLIYLAAASDCCYSQTNTSQDKQKVFEHLKANIKKYGFVEDVILNDTACKLIVKYNNRDIEITISKISEKHFSWDKRNKQIIFIMKSLAGQTAFRESRKDRADSYNYTSELCLAF